jgi:hypothetical protein
MNATATKCTSTCIPDAGTDAFFAAQVAMLRAAGFWAEATTYNAFGNRHSAMSLVPVAGDKPKAVFEGQYSYGNVFRFEVRLYRGETVLMTTGNHVWRADAPKVFMAPENFTIDALRDAFADFMAHAKLHGAV